MKYILINIFLFSASHSLKAQNDSHLFLNGITLNDKNVVIPWGASYSDIGKYGKPKYSCSGWSTSVAWDSVIVLGSIKANIYTNDYFHCYLKKTPRGKLNNIYSSIDSTDIQKVVDILTIYSGKEPQVGRSKKMFSYYWIIDGCNVQVGYWKHLNWAYMSIQTTKLHR